MIITDIGLSSSLIYRMVVSGPLHNFTVQLVATNNTDVPLTDTVWQDASAKSLAHVTNDAGVPTGSSFPEGVVSGAYMWGSVEVRQGQSLRYIANGTNITACWFSIDDLIKIDEIGKFTFNASLSVFPGNPSEVNATVEPGVYWFLVRFGGSSQEQFFTPYWD